MSFEPSHDKTTTWHVCPAKTQISLGIHPVWSESLLSAWRNLWLSLERTAKTLIRLGRCPGWSECSLGVQIILLVLSWGGSFVISLLEHMLLILILFVMPALASCDIGVHLSIHWSIHISASMNVKPLAVTNHKIYSSYLVYFRWASSSEFGTYRLCEQRRFRRACAFAQSRQNLRCSLIQAMSQEEPSDRKPDP